MDSSSQSETNTSIANDATNGASMKTNDQNPFYSLHNEIQMQFNGQQKDDTAETYNFGRTLKSEWTTYMSLPLLNYDDNPISEWHKLKFSCPLLFKIAVKYCVVMGSSVPSERMFSTTGRIMQTRSRLSPERLSKLVVLHSMNGVQFQNILKEI